jgi:hypothetical protein
MTGAAQPAAERGCFSDHAPHERVDLAAFFELLYECVRATAPERYAIVRR